jgi:hypothetical protein
MACTPTSLVAATNCDPSVGGLLYSYFAKFSDITSFTVTSGAITALVMSTTGLWKAWKPTRDSTAYFNATGSAPTKSSFQLDQVAFLKFAGISKESVKAANSMIPCCDLVGVHFLNDGSVLFQGIELNAAGTGIVQSKEAARFVPSILSGSGDDESKTEFLVNSKAKNQAVGDPATITEAYITGL